MLLQQGGQLKDVFGGVGGAVRALASVFTVARVAAGAVAAAIGTIAYQAFAGAQQSAALNKALALTGNTAATSGGQISAMAEKIATSQQAAVGDVHETLTALATSGAYSQTTLESAGKAAVALSKLIGESAAETIKQFDGMGNGVAAWAQKSNQAYNFLTLEQFKYIQSLEAQGRTQEAMKVALDALSSTMEQRSVPAVGSLERAWSGVKSTLSGVLEYFRSIGRDETAEQKLAKIQQTLELTKAAQARSAKPESFAPAIAALQSQVDAQDAMNLALDRGRKRDAAAQEQTQLDLIREGKAFQDTLSAISSAGSQKRYAEELAALDRRQAGVELARAKDLISNRDYNEQVNAIEQQRLQAQAAAIQREIGIASSRKVEKLGDAEANQAQVVALQGQLAQVRGQITAAAVKARQIVETDAFAESTETTEAWTQMWKLAFDQVRSLAQQNAATNAAQIAQPIERARAEAALKVADVERQVGELQAKLTLRLNLTLDPARAAQLQAEIDRLGKEAKASIDETTRAATFQSLQQQFSDLAQSIALEESRLDALVEQSALTTVEAERRKFAARAAALPQLEEIQRAQAALATTVGERNTIESQAQSVLRLKDTTTELQRSLKDAGVNAFVTEIGNIGSGAKTAKQGLLDMVGSFAKAWGDLLNRRLGEQFYDQLSSAASKFAAENSGGWLGTLLGFFGLGGGSSAASSAGVGSAGSGTGATYAHTGAVIGGAGGWRQTVPAALFQYAPRYHTGGIAGLKPNEVPAILQHGEEVLTKSDPRHVRNGGSSAVGDVNISVQVSGAEGTATDQRGAVDKLTTQVKAIVVEWATEQTRQGGILAKAR